MTTRTPKQLSSTPLVDTLLKKIAEHDAKKFGTGNPNESFTFRRLVMQEAQAIGLTQDTAPTAQKGKSK